MKKEEDETTGHAGTDEPLSHNSGGKVASSPRALPRECKHLESLFELQGLGASLWEGIDPDDYVRELREGWD
jgi:hypothetical protein